MDLPDIFTPKFLNEAATPVAREIGTGLGDLVYLVFSPIHKARMKREFDLTAFMETLKANVEAIPEGKLVEPPLHIVGPALEASKYYYEEKDLRDMFAKLIASSMNSDTQEIVRSPFVEIIKQMSPFDAIVLKELYHKIREIGVGRVRYNFHDETGGFTVYDYLFPLSCLTLKSQGLVASSVSNIIRLGLISINEGSQYVDETLYDYITEHEVFKNFQNNREYDKPGNYKLYGMTWKFTPLGLEFAQCCLSNVEDITIEMKSE